MPDLRPTQSQTACLAPSQVALSAWCPPGAAAPVDLTRRRPQDPWVVSASSLRSILNMGSRSRGPLLGRTFLDAPTVRFLRCDVGKVNGPAPPCPCHLLRRQVAPKKATVLQHGHSTRNVAAYPNSGTTDLNRSDTARYYCTYRIELLSALS